MAGTQRATRENGLASRGSIPYTPWTDSAASSAPSRPTCTDGAPFDFEVGVYLPPGSPNVQLRVTDVIDGTVLWEGVIRRSATVTGPSGGHWAAHVGESAPPDPRPAELPAHRPLRFDFGTSFTPFVHGSFEYQFCRAPGTGQTVPAGTFRCPQNLYTVEDDTHLVSVYAPLVHGHEGMAVVIPSVMDGIGTFDDLVADLYWVLPYDLEQACGRSCGGGPGDLSGCDPAVAERTTPFLRRLIAGTSSPRITTNPTALWVVRPGRTVEWDAAEFYGINPNIAFQGGACVEVGGQLQVSRLTLSANEPFGPWLGMYVLEDGLLRLKEGTSVSYAGNRSQLSVPGAVRTFRGEVVLDDAVLSDNFAPGLYVSGAGGHATVEGASIIRESYLPDSPTIEVPGVDVAMGASALIMDDSRVEFNSGAGVRAAGYGTSVNLHEAIVESNEVGVEARDAAEVFFGRTDLGDPNPVAESRVRFNTEGNVSAEGGASLIAGISDGVVCQRFCNNTIERDPQGSAYDARSVLGGVNYAEANYWGEHVQDVSDLVLIHDPASFLSVEPILDDPPSLTSGGSAGERGAGGGLHRGDGPGDVRALVGEARALEAEGDTARAFAAISAALLAALSEDEQRQAYTSAAAMVAQPNPCPS